MITPTLCLHRSRFLLSDRMVIVCRWLLQALPVEASTLLSLNNPLTSGRCAVSGRGLAGGFPLLCRHFSRVG